MRPRVVITHWVHPEVLELLGGACEVVANPTRDTLPREEVLRRCRDADAALVFMPDRVDEAFLAACPRLKVVAGALKGYDNLDVTACARRGVWCTVVPDLLTAPTAELTVALLLGLARRVPEGDRLVRGGHFAGWRPVLYGAGLAGATVGLVGLGAIGRAVARRLAGFEARLLYCDPAPLPPEEERGGGLTRADLPELLSASDFVVLLVPLTPATRHLIDRAALGRFRPGSFLVNTCRGSVVDEEAVADALEAGRLAGYAADVFALEDWSDPGRPAGLCRRLREMAGRTLFTPHLGSAVDRVRRDIALAAAHNVLQALRGEVPADAVNRPSPPLG
jgi:phosphonate dehydrogenase